MILWYTYKNKTIGRVKNKDIYYEIEKGDDKKYSIILISHGITSLIKSDIKTKREAKIIATKHLNRKCITIKL